MALGLALIAPTPVMAQSNADGLRQALSQYQAEIGDGGTPSPSTLAGLRANRELLETWLTAPELAELNLEIADRMLDAEDYAAAMRATEWAVYYYTLAAHAQTSPTLSADYTEAAERQMERGVNLFDQAVDAGVDLVAPALLTQWREVAQTREQRRLARTRSGTGEAGADGQYEIVRVFYGTNREQVSNEPEDAYSNQRSTLTTGFVDVSVPLDRRRGAIPRPSIVDFGREDPRLHIILTRMRGLEGRGSFKRALRDSLEEARTTSGQNDMLIYLHGHGTPFDGAARRAAQLAVDLDMRGGATFYSWPNGQSVGAYQISQNNVGVSARSFESFLERVLGAAGETRVHIIAHSMGNRLLLEALQRIADRQQMAAPVLAQVIWASPDVDAELFAGSVGEIAHLAEGMTAYVSRHDRALSVSMMLGGNYPRAGQASPLPAVASVVHAIDTSDVAVGIGHTDFTIGALDDLRAALWLGLSPSERCVLAEQELEQQALFWSLGVRSAQCDPDSFQRAVQALRAHGDSALEELGQELEDMQAGRESARLRDEIDEAIRIVEEIQAR
ncbi:MAG: alpha/beta hydrolase [Maricaulis sp.]|uniref:alpha/beta hydrolase n=1 Tax=Maricaulis sp. TaxID=1486257 RepID=UPI001B0E5845|nr:alpha/beta hydrolase [Maricaulis sp.]MBO6878379.1 alpha/beta hydrolase [Maricaulis sp.]